MGLSINTNIASMNAQRNLGKTQGTLNKSLQRLSSGLRINSAKDDAAGLAIGTRMGAQVRGLNQAIRNANDGISLAQTAEGALQETTNLLQRIRELAVQSANDTNTASDRASMQAEVSQLLQELGRVAETTQFNGKSLLNGTFTGAQFQVGANANQTISMGVDSAKTSDLGSYQANGAVAVTAVALAGGDLLINGTDVGVSTDGSAESKAISINAVSDTTGVTASATTSVSSDQTLLRNQTLLAGDLTVNGINVGAVSGSYNIATQGSNLATAINAVTNQTGVIATSDLSTGALTLTSSTGKDIVIDSNNSDAGYNRLENATGFAVSASTEQSTNTIAFTNGVKAVNTFTVAAADAGGVGVEDETLTIGTHQFTYVANGSGNSATEIDIGTTGAEHITNMKAAIVLAEAAGSISNVTISGTATTTVVTSDVATITTTHTATAETATNGSWAENFAGAGVGVGNTVTVGGVTYEFVLAQGDSASGTNIAVAIGADDNTTETNLQGAVVNQYSLGNSNIVATIPAADLVLTADLLGTSGNATVDATVDLTAGDAGTAASIGETIVTASDGAGTEATNTGILELNASVQYTLTGNGLAKAGLQSATPTLAALNTVDISTVAGSNDALSVLDGAMSQITSSRGDLGALQNRFESTISNLQNVSENISAARARIMDADFAAETAAMTKAQVLQQAGVAMLAQANQLPQAVLSLLQ